MSAFRSFLLGAARVLDISGSLSAHRPDFMQGTPAEIDERALASDWAVVEADLDEALRKRGYVRNSHPRSAPKA